MARIRKKKNLTKYSYEPIVVNKKSPVKVIKTRLHFNVKVCSVKFMQKKQAVSAEVGYKALDMHEISLSFYEF